MTEREICIMYREARNQNTQLQVLAELNDVSRNEIIRILVKNGEKLPSRAINQLYKRLDVLEAQISEREKEYREIVRALNGSVKQDRRTENNELYRGNGDYKH